MVWNVRGSCLKGACSKIVGKLIFFNSDHFSKQYYIQGEKIANVFLICKQFEKTVFMLLTVL